MQKQARRRGIQAYRISLAVMLLIGLAAAAFAVVLDDENRRTVVLDSGLQVQLIGEAVSVPGKKSNKYYYLPVNLRLSRRPDNTPEFLFLKYVTEKRDGVNGALLHFLMEYGLSPQQEEELRAKLKRQNNQAELMGAVPMEAEGEGGSFDIVSGTLKDKNVTPVVATSGKAPLLPGGKAAAAARMTGEGAQMLAATLEKTRSIADASIVLNYSYSVMVPAVKAHIEIDWAKLEMEHNQLRDEYKRKKTDRTSNVSCFIFCFGSETQNYEYTRDEVQSMYSFLQEKKIVRVVFDEFVPATDERLAKVREAFFQYFLNTLTQPAQQEAPPAASSSANSPQGGQRTEVKPDLNTTTGYKFTQSALRTKVSKKFERLELNYRMTMRKPLQIIGNLTSWYDGARDNKNCVASVYLNDPFFQHLDIRFILDGEIKDVFEETVNYVTINVRKRRSNGRPFEDRATIDAKHLKEKGVQAVITYARGEDNDAEVYEYQTQWSLRGDRRYPENPKWQKGQLEGQTLALPIAPRVIQVEGDLAAMTANDITRATVQVRYSKLGEEVEENISVSPAENKPLVDKKILIDRNAKGFAYRVIVYHKTEGKLALPWTPHTDNYVYAPIPAELLKTPRLVTEAKEAAKETSKNSAEKVLDKFKELAGETRPQ